MKKLIWLFCLFFSISLNCLRAATITVSTGNDSGPGSLRQAILDANRTLDRDTVNFSINQRRPITAPTIHLASALPAITQPIIIDGTTEAAGRVELDGSTAG